MEKKKLILDYSKWRCGGSYFDTSINGENILGDGFTMLLNIEGFMCCLGQFSLQLNPLLTKDDIRDVGYPIHLHKKIPLLIDTCGTKHSNLAEQAIDINDDHHTTPKEKIEKLRELFGKEGYEIEVINKL